MTYAVTRTFSVIDRVTQAELSAHPDEASAIAAASAREEGAASVITSSLAVRVNYATPKVAAIDYTGNVSQARQVDLARFGCVQLGMWPSIGLDRMAAHVAGIKALNPQTFVHQYVGMSCLSNTLTPSDDFYPLMQAVNTGNLWLRTASGALTQQTKQPGRFDVWAGDGRWPKIKAAFDAKMIPPGLDGLFVDDCMATNRLAADFLRIGSDQKPKDGKASALQRQGIRYYLDELRAYGLPLTGNIDTGGIHGLDTPEFAGQFEGVFLEGTIGKAWSVETWAGLEGLMKLYATAQANAKRVILNVHAGDEAMRLYGLAVCLLGDAYYAPTPPVNGYVAGPQWYPEFDTPIGQPLEPMPAAAVDGVWRRRYTNAQVFVNGSKTATAQVGGLTLAPRSGAILVNN